MFTVQLRPARCVLAGAGFPSGHKSPAAHKPQSLAHVIRPTPSLNPTIPRPPPHPPTPLTHRNHPDLMKGYPEVVDFYEYWE